MKPIEKLTLNLSFQATKEAAATDVYDADMTILVQQKMMELIQNFKERSSCLQILKGLEKLFTAPVALTQRAQIFQSLNQIGQKLMAVYTQDQDIFNAYFAAMTRFKIQLDRTPQTNEQDTECEWEELQKSVYLLTDWENFSCEMEQVPCYQTLQ